MPRTSVGAMPSAFRAALWLLGELSGEAAAGVGFAAEEGVAGIRAALGLPLDEIVAAFGAAGG